MQGKMIEGVVIIQNQTRILGWSQMTADRWKEWQTDNKMHISPLLATKKYLLQVCLAL